MSETPPTQPGGLHPATRLVHPPSVRLETEPVGTPIFRSSTFRARRASELSDRMTALHPGDFYTRWGNPTVDVLERVLADLEGGEHALAFASGMAAISTTLLALVEPGDHIVCGHSLYGGTSEVIHGELRKLGISATAVDPREPGSFAAACRPETRLLYVESPANPTLELTDIAAVASLGRERGVTVIADNTFASPIVQNPLRLGADIVLHSATKYLAGHSDLIAGFAVFGREDAYRQVWSKAKLLGGCLDPESAWLLLRGLKTLELRVERAQANAAELAERLEGHPAVERVFHPSLPSHPQREVADRQMRGGGGMVAFAVRGGRDAGIRLAEALELIVLAVSLGGPETLIEHPASMSHSPLSEEQLEAAGIAPGLLRLSVGIENVEDLWHDLKQALDRL